LPDRPAGADTKAPPDVKRKVEGALTAAAIAAIIIQASRAQYQRDGRACGGRSAYSRPGGAAPLCYNRVEWAEAGFALILFQRKQTNGIQMQGQWLGRYTGTKSGGAILEIDEVGDHYE
jgi:hypothetical protein